MPNILLSTDCNLRCPYCFAQQKIRAGPRFMSMKNVSFLLDFLQDSKYPYFRVMGGEPTLHTKFGAIVEKAMRRGFLVDVLSNATWSKDLNDFFGGISPERLQFLLNINPERTYRPALYASIMKNLEFVSSHFRTTLSFNIASRNPQYGFIVDLARNFAIRTVRLSHSLPVYGCNNEYLPLADYRAVGAAILHLAEELREIGSRCILDNAVLPCAFTEAQIGRLVSLGVLDLARNLKCKPILDIGPDLAVWCCFCLSKCENRSLREFGTLADVYSYYSNWLQGYQSRRSPFSECAGCVYRETWECQGGCIAFALAGMDSTKLDVPAKPAFRLSDGVQLREFRVPQKGYVLLDTKCMKTCEIPREIALLLKNGKPKKDRADDFLFQQEVAAARRALEGLEAKGFVTRRAKC